MTTYTAKRNALENAIIDVLCKCGVRESCVTCSHMPVCATARRLKHAIEEERRKDIIKEFAVWAENSKECVHDDNL